jgi:hypothetical protein
LGNQPQGGFKTRRPTPPAAPPVVVSSPWSGGGGFFGFGFGYLQDPPPNRKPVKARPNTRRTYTTPGWW